ncbi:MAG: hypothetical protein L0G25_00985 [Psychrobacter sp.]|nr:hypothetical protein [Psychrobacter sp.]
MSKSRLRKSHKGLCLVFILFFTSILLSFLGFDKVSKILFYAIFPVFFWAYFYGAIFVFKANKKFFSRIKHKQTVFTDSLTDDEDDSPYIKSNDNDKKQ